MSYASEMINFLSEVRKRQPANQIMRVDKVENSFGEARMGGNCEEKAGASSVGTVANRK